MPAAAAMERKYIDIFTKLLCAQRRSGIMAHGRCPHQSQEHAKGRVCWKN